MSGQILRQPRLRSIIPGKVRRMGAQLMTVLRAGLCALLLACSGASAQPVSFKGKSITMLIGFPSGGGTDLSGRLIASVLARHLPGEPMIVVQNMPGAEGL